MIKDPLISVVMPVYNVEKYLQEAVDSIINQTIGFKKNIELIFINDGSTDDSESILLEYKKQYPKNIVYVKQPNQGLSASRYNGFLKARGIYIHSMDSDDTITDNFYEKAISFLEDHHEEIDIVASKLLFFEARTGDHYLNYRFSQSRVVNVDREPRAFQYHIASCVIRRTAIKEEWFDKKISIGEDARLIAIILRQKRAYGVVSDIAYNYRIREAGGSLINTQHMKRDYYTETPKRFWQFALDLWTDDKGHIATFIQNEIMNDIHWRLNEQKKQEVLSESELAHYKKVVYDTISRLDDTVILNQEDLSLTKRIYLLKKKYGRAFQKIVTCKDGKYTIGSTHIINARAHSDFFGLKIDFFHSLGGGRYHVEGYPVNDLIHPDDSFFIQTSKGKYPLQYVERAQRRQNAFLGDAFHKQEAFEATISTGEEDEVKGILETVTGEVVEIPLFTGRHTRIGPLNYSYKRVGDTLIRKQKGVLYIRPRTTLRHIRHELLFMLQIARNIRLKDSYKLVKEALGDLRMREYAAATRKIWFSVFSLLRNALLNIMSIVLRVVHRISTYARKTEPIWIISDRAIAAGDNGEAFFKYLNSITPSIKYYFAINKNSPDYDRLKAIGPVVNMRSVWYKLLFLKADKIISSQADEYIINPFGRREVQLLDLFHFDFIFLQHGVTKNDISGWLNRFFKNIRLFVTVSKREYNSILENPFYYSDKQLLLSGFPRYDLLENRPAGKIILAPTWRKYLTNGKLSKKGSWEYQDEFKNSEYYAFYNSLLNDKRILKALEGANMTGEFYLHPSHEEQICDFKGNEIFKVKSFPYDYPTALREGDLMITDYSSVYFDFSYLRKPVIYSQFDHDYFYQNHGVYEEGYFKEADDGFGPVCYDYDTLVGEIIKSIQSGCQLEQKYKERIDRFFEFHDKNNSKRVYEAIKKV